MILELPSKLALRLREGETVTYPADKIMANALVIERVMPKSRNYEDWRIVGKVWPSFVDICEQVGCDPKCMSSLDCWSVMRRANAAGIDVVIHGMKKS